MDKVLTTGEDEFSSHFYENPVLLVKKRKEERRRLEELNRRQRAKEEKMREGKFEDDDDLFYEKSTKKFVVKDVDRNEREAKRAVKRKREERDAYLNQMLPKEVRGLMELEDKVNAMHKRKKTSEKEMDIDDFIPMKYLKAKPKNDKSKGKVNLLILIDGHFIKQSGASFLGKNTKSDTLKKGQHEPYAYIKLNPKMMNKRFRDKAVKSFGTVVDKKKADKRKTKEGMLAGLTVTKQK